MKTPPISALFKGAGQWAKRNSPHLLVAAGIIGMAGTVIAAVKASAKAKELLDEAQEEKEEPLTPAETVKTVWKCYAVPAVAFCVSAACIIGANAQNVKRNAALMTACSISQTALSTYQEKVIETIGEEGEKQIRKKASKEVSEKQNVSPEEVYILGGNKVCCVDCLGNEFEADPEDIKHAVNIINERLNEQDYASLNELYYEISDVEDTKIGNYLGWNRSNGLLKVIFGSDISHKNRPRLVVTYSPLPRYDYDKC